MRKGFSGHPSFPPTPDARGEISKKSNPLSQSNTGFKTQIAQHDVSSVLTLSDNCFLELPTDVNSLKGGGVTASWVLRAGAVIG